MGGWSQCEEAEQVRSQNSLRDTYPAAFGPYGTSTVSFPNQSEARDLLLQVKAQEEIRSLSTASDNLYSSTSGTYMDEDGVHLFLHDSAWVSKVQGKSSRPMRRACRPELDSHPLLSDSICPEPECGITHPVSIPAASTVKVPSDTHIVYETWV